MADVSSDLVCVFLHLKKCTNINYDFAAQIHVISILQVSQNSVSWLHLYRSILKCPFMNCTSVQNTNKSFSVLRMFSCGISLVRCHILHLQKRVYMFALCCKTLKCWKYQHQSWHQSLLGIKLSNSDSLPPAWPDQQQSRRTVAELWKDSGSGFNKRPTQTADASPCQLLSGLPNSW